MQNEEIIYIQDISRIGIQLGNIRRRKGMTISEVSIRADVTPTFICKVEHGKCIARIGTLLDWCKALGYKEVRFTV